MRILSRYIFREIIAGSFLATAIVTFVIFLKEADPIFALMVRATRAGIVAELLGLSLLPVLLLSIPFGVLVGILIGLGRMSADNEMVAMRSAGVSTRIVVAPVLFFAFLGTLVSGASSLWLNPWAIQQEYKLLNKIAVQQVTADVTPRTFQEQFTSDNTVLYVDDISTGTGPAVWRGVFIADTSPPSQRKTPNGVEPRGPVVTLAREALAIPDPKFNRIQLSLIDQSVHESPIHSIAPVADTALRQAPPAVQTVKPVREMKTRELIRYTRSLAKKSDDYIEAALELHRRFAFPIACLTLAMVGIPLGSSTKRGGRSSGYVWGIFLCFCCYYMFFIALTNMAKSHNMEPILASWLPNIAFAFAGVALIARMETPGDRDHLGGVRRALESLLSSVIRLGDRQRSSESRPAFRLAIFQITDNFVLSGFISYFILWIAAFVSMTQIYTFFELFGDSVKHHIPLSETLRYHIFLTPELLYDTLPYGVLLAVLVTFGVMTRNNEVTAFKACGVSVRRLAVPVIVAAAVLSGAAFAADLAWIPQANRIQDSIHNEIKGRAARTYLNPQRQWVNHEHRFFYFKHFDIEEKVMIEPWVYEIEPKTFRLTRAITASRARWEPTANAWVFEQGDSFDICDRVIECHPTHFTVTSFPEITETPGDFSKEVRQNQQMNYKELGDYISDLKNSGFDTIKFQVEYYRKFTAPLFALTIALISIPFGFLVGNRGAMAGVGVSLALAMAYLGTEKLFEQLGNVGYLPPQMAAWSPDALFALAGMYLMLRMRT